MELFDPEPCVLYPIKMDITREDLSRKLSSTPNKTALLQRGEGLVKGLNQSWTPGAVHGFFKFSCTGPTTGHLKKNLLPLESFDFGQAIDHLTMATHALVWVCTAGPQLEQASKKASQQGDLLGSYLFDLMGLIVLEKVTDHLKQKLHEKIKALDFGVSPLLSPGAVLGWDIHNQTKLCSLLPIEKIKVTISKDGVLSPFKTISCLIGLGKEYESNIVGSPCQLCTGHDKCPMKHTIFQSSPF